MDVDFARALGEILAFQTNELNKDPHDKDALDRIAVISEAYRNFVSAGLSGFKESFESGLGQAQRDVRFDQGKPDSLPNLSDSDFDGPQP